MKTPRQPITFPRIAGLLSAATGVLVLVGWVLDIPWIKSVLPGAVEMKANTAVCLLLAGVSLRLLAGSPSPRQRWAGQALALVVALIGFATVAEYALGWRLGIDELLFRDTTDAYNPFRGRMSPYSAVVFASLGLGLMALPRRSLRWLVWLAANLSVLIGGMSFIGYLWSASELITDRILPPVAVNTAAVFVLLGVGLLMAGRAPVKRSWRDWVSLSTVETKTFAGFLTTLVLLLVMGGYAYRAAVGMAGSARYVAHTQQVRASLGRLQAAVLEAESQQRNYLLSGNQDYLEDYQHHASEAGQQAKDLARFIADNPAQLQRLNEIQGLIGERLAVLENTRITFEQAGLAAAQAVIANEEGLRLMAAIRDAVGRMDAVEAELLKARLADSAAKQVKTLLALLVTLAVATAGFMMLYSGIRRELAARAKTEEDLSVTLHSIGDAVLATDPEGRVTRMNSVAEKLTGWTQAEAQGRPVAEVFHILNEQTREPAVIPVDRVLATGEIHGLANHTVIIARNGTERPITDSAAPIRDKDGRIHGVVLVFRDVTEEKQAEKTIRESELLNRAVLDSVLANIAVVDRHGIIIAINEGWERFARENGSHASMPGMGLGANYLEVCARAARDMGAEAQEIIDGIRGVLAHSQPMFRHEYDCHSPTEQRWFSMQVSPLVRSEGGAVITQINITERKRAEEEVRRLNAGLEELVAQRTAEVREAFATLDATVDGAFTFEPESLRFIHVNKGAVRQLGYAHEELLALTPPDIDAKHDAAAFREMIAPLLRGEKSVLAYETVYRRKDGGTLPVEINLQYVRPAGAAPRFIAIARDITERKQAERLARRSQRMESIGTLAAGVAHDLNNALAPIMMSGGILRMEYPGESQSLDMIENCTKRASDMVRQLLAFAKGAEGERIPLSPIRLVKDMQKIMEGSFPKNLELAIKCAPELPRVLGDATQLHQVLLNLCVNARDAMPNGGILTLEAESRVMDATYASSIPDALPGNYVVLRVSDTGAGIPPEIIDRIFDPFFTTKGPDKGTGLGLSTVLGIVKGHGGFLHVYSQPGQGSVFTIYLPVESAGGDTELTAKATVTFRGQGEVILLVDDESAVRQAAQAVLRRLNFKPLTATDGADGMMQAAQCPGDLRAVITDLHMPHMDGLAFVRALRRMLPDIPVAVASGRLEDAVAEEFKALGVTCRLDKPFTEAQLAEALKQLLAPK